MRILGIIPESTLAIQITHCQMVFLGKQLKHTNTRVCVVNQLKSDFVNDFDELSDAQISLSQLVSH